MKIYFHSENIADSVAKKLFAIGIHEETGFSLRNLFSRVLHQKKITPEDEHGDNYSIELTDGEVRRIEREFGSIDEFLQRNMQIPVESLPLVDQPKIKATFKASDFEALKPLLTAIGNPPVETSDNETYQLMLSQNQVVAIDLLARARIFSKDLLTIEAPRLVEAAPKISSP